MDNRMSSNLPSSSLQGLCLKLSSMELGSVLGIQLVIDK